MPSAPVVTVHLWGVPTRAIPGSLVRMATGRRKIRRIHGLRFAKLLGTGSGETFSVRDADFHHWGLIACWDDESDARVFELSSLVTTWDHHSFEKARFALAPVSSRGLWSGEDPFSPCVRHRSDGPVAAITRARIPMRHWRRFARAVPPVADATSHAPGLIVRTGIGEAPVGLQGTFSVWQDSSALNAFTTGAAHQRVVDDTARVGWYSEELFARFGVTSATGTFCGTAVDAHTLPRIGDEHD